MGINLGNAISHHQDYTIVNVDNNAYGFNSLMTSAQILDALKAKGLYQGNLVLIEKSFDEYNITYKYTGTGFQVVGREWNFEVDFDTTANTTELSTLVTVPYAEWGVGLRASAWLALNVSGLGLEASAEIAHENLIKVTVRNITNKPVNPSYAGVITVFGKVSFGT